MGVLLMLKDTPVMELHVSRGMFDVIHPELMPWSLRGYIVEDNVISSNEAFMRWMADRVIPISRRNADAVYKVLGLSTTASDGDKSALAIKCHAVSLLDSYWVKSSSELLQWKDVNLRGKHWSTRLQALALCRVTKPLHSIVSPELSTNGSFAKAWNREQDGLYLHKRSSTGGLESDVEIMCSRLLDKMNVRHVVYERSELYGVPTCKCKLMSDEIISIMPAADMIYYTKANGLNYYEHVMRLDYTNICKMFIVDYLIANKDRHSQNWGFEYEGDTTEICQCHKLFDHNLAFDKEYMKNPDAMYKFNNKASMRRAATKAMEQVDFHFTAPIDRGDFITKEQYDCFMRRAEELNIETKEK